MQKRTSRQFSPEDRHSFRALQHSDFTCERARVKELLRGLLSNAECMDTPSRKRWFGLI